MTNIKTKQADKKGTQETQVAEAQCRVAQGILDSHQTTDLEQMRLQQSDQQIKEQLFTEAYDRLVVSARYQLRFHRHLGHEEYKQYELDAVSKVWKFLAGKNLDEFRDCEHAIASMRKRAKGAIQDTVRRETKKSEAVCYTDMEISEGVEETTPEDLLCAKQLLEVLQGLDLSDNERYVLDHVLLGGQSQVSVANALGIQKPAISKTVKRVRQKAALALTEAGYDISPTTRKL